MQYLLLQYIVQYNKAGKDINIINIAIRITMCAYSYVLCDYLNWLKNI